VGSEALAWSGDWVGAVASEPVVDQDDPDDLARDAIEAADGPLRACGWVSVDDGPVTLPGVIVWLFRRSRMRSPFLLAVTDAHFFAFDVRWPGPSVRRLARWDAHRVRVATGASQEYNLTLPGGRALPIRVQNDGPGAAALREALERRIPEEP
jgi:hypothetical protein